MSLGRGSLSAFIVAMLLLSAAPVRAADQFSVPQLLAPPVDAVIGHFFEAPATAYGPGHRGIDYEVAAGTRVRAAGSGTVTWAGSVAGNLSVTIDHGDGLETTYSILSNIEVQRGMTVDQGRFIGSVDRDHEANAGGLHFGVKLHDEYVDPLDYLGPADITGAIHLAPLIEDEKDDLPYELSLVAEGAGALARPCRDPVPLLGIPPAPNDNIAVAIAGINSHTSGGTNAEIYQPGNGPEALGYDPSRSYEFSYRGARGPNLHEPYEPSDTSRDIRVSAESLRDQLVRLHRRYPGADIDLFAHSQGGLVARAMLEYLAEAYDPRLPRVEHLITYGTPHRGTPIASVASDIENETLSGRFVVGELSDWAKESGVIPDPRSPAIDQMRPDSDLVTGLAREDVTFGTRVLALAMPHDAIAPADHALYPGKLGRVLSPESLNGHDAVVASAQGRAIAYAFLRDAAVSCRGNWDEWGPVVGSAIGWAQGMIADAYSSLETAGLVRAFKVAKWAGAKGWDALKWTGQKGWAAIKWTGGRIVSGARRVTDAGKWVVGRAADAGRLIHSGLAKLWPD